MIQLPHETVFPVVSNKCGVGGEFDGDGDWLAFVGRKMGVYRITGVAILDALAQYQARIFIEGDESSIKSGVIETG